MIATDGKAIRVPDRESGSPKAPVCQSERARPTNRNHRQGVRASNRKVYSARACGGNQVREGARRIDLGER
jgi:hypothetical protein